MVGTPAYGMGWLQTHTKPGKSKNSKKVRSVNALRCKAYREKLKGLNTGTKSLKALSGTTGYSKTQLLRAQRALNQKWLRSSNKGNYLITINQIEELLDWLKDDYWCVSKRLYNCAYCGKYDNPHMSWGLCTNCLALFRKLCRKYKFTVSQWLINKLLKNKSRELKAISRRLRRKVALTEVQILKVLEIDCAN